MHPREFLLGKAKAMQLRGEPIPLDMLVEAERLGLSLEIFNDPITSTENDANLQEGEFLNGTEDYI